MIDIRIQTQAEYTVHIGSGILNDCGKIMSALIAPCTVAIVSDTNVAPLYMQTVKNSLVLAGYKVIEYVFPAGERSKNVQTLAKLWEFFAESELTRKDAIIALGGGVVGDVTGFAAATYLRGVPYVQVPTSLLACVDSSVGGKTAVDLAAGKNLAGAFNQPIAVICDTDTISTLPEENVSDGAAECIKYGVLGNKRILEIFEGLPEDVNVDANGVPTSGYASTRPLYEKIKDSLEEIIAESVRMKASFVCRDEFDTGDRMYLNLGHTIGHAIEHCSNFELSHGHAVAIGMRKIALAGERHGITKPGTADRLTAILKKSCLPTDCEFDTEQLVSAGLRDKKRSGGKLTLIVPKNILSCKMRIIPVEEFSDWL